MLADHLLQIHLENACPDIHSSRLQAVIDVAYGLQRSQNLGITAMGRNINSASEIKHKVKKVDRLENNKHLHNELSELYSGLSSYVFKYLVNNSTIPIIVDLCFMKDEYQVQMLSAEVATKGRSIPIYREVFSAGDFKDRAESFLHNMHECLPKDKAVLIVMDAGFGESWFKAIDAYDNWYWLTRIRKGKKIRLAPTNDWQSITEITANIGSKATAYNSAAIMVKHNRTCRIITTKKCPSLRNKLKKLPRNDKAANNGYRLAANEPWILATNAPLTYNTSQIVNYYSKRMQIEESFRDIKSSQFGLSGRYVRTTCVQRWGVKMLLAAIVQITCWIIGIIGHSQGFQKKFQVNTVKDKKVFSYFYLGRLIIEFNKIGELKMPLEKLDEIIDQELARKW